MLAKGWLLSIQFEELFQNHLFYDMAAHSNQMAAILRKGISGLGYQFASASMTNQLFPVFPDQLIEKLSRDYRFSIQEKSDDSHSVIRLVTSWATKEEAVRSFLNDLKALTPESR